MSIYELKKLREAKRSQLLKDKGVFSAFSDKQFEENKTPLSEGDQYLALGSGMYIPLSNFESFQVEGKAIIDWFNETVSKGKIRRAYISYELSNHEAYYSGSIDSTLDALGNGFTVQEVHEVYIREQRKQIS